MAKLTKEQIMVVTEMVQDERASIRQVARQLGVTEGAVRYHLRKGEGPSKPDGRANKPTAVSGFEEAVGVLLERLEDGRLTGEGRPVQARTVYELLQRDYGYTGSYRGVVRHLRRRFGVPPVRAYRRVETPPGVQGQHDWFEARTRMAGERITVQALMGVLSHSRARFCWISREANQLAWHTGHLGLFWRYGGVPLWIRIDNLKTGVIRGAGASAVLNPTYRVFARECGFQIDPCRPATGSDKGKAERSVRTFRSAFGDLFQESWSDLASLQRGLDERAQSLLDRLRCPVTGTPVREAWEAERACLQPMPLMSEPFDVVVARRVTRDCLVCFEGRRYSVPFTWVGRQVEILGTLTHVSIRGDGLELARYPRKTRELLLLQSEHFEGESTERVLRPTPLGVRARLQLAGLSAGDAVQLVLPAPERVKRPLERYVALVEAAR